LSPDGQTVVFTMLGHLFSLPVSGGTADQLTFGPHYDDSPSFSPNGSQVAFTSDRDGSEGNIFVLDLKSGQILQLTHEEVAGQQVWSPDGRFLVYLRYARTPVRDHPAVVARIPVGGGEPEILSTPPRRIGQPFYLSGGQLAWSVIERDSQSASDVTRIEALNEHGTASTLRTILGSVDRVLSGPGGDGYYCHRITGASGFNPGVEEIVFVPSAARRAFDSGD
jgi:dipeptidyl aminopeptidase/acylaminoacyl peptidase